jgi:hypothetical protein
LNRQKEKAEMKATRGLVAARTYSPVPGKTKINNAEIKL